MIRINVAPEIEIQYNRSDILKPILVLFVFVGLGYYIPIYLSEGLAAKALEFNAMTSEKKEKLKQLRLDVDKIRVLKQKQVDLESRGRQVRDLSEGRKQPIYFLDKLQQEHHERLWLEALSMENKKVTMIGWALDHNIISEYMRRLKSYVGTDSGDAVDLKSFTPEFNAVPTVPVKTKIEISSIFPLAIKNVTLKNSKTEALESVELQKFTIEFEPNFH